MVTKLNVTSPFIITSLTTSNTYRTGEKKHWTVMAEGKIEGMDASLTFSVEDPERLNIGLPLSIEVGEEAEVPA